MPSTYSTNLAIELIGTGDQAGVWGNTTNTNLGTLIEQAISGYVTQAVSTGTDTTITIPNGATGVARNMYIELTGTGGASTNLIVPANKKLYFIFNNTSSGQVTVKVSGQTGVSVPNKAKMVLVSNGTDIVDATNYLANLSAASANITVLTSASATITNLLATSLTVSSGSTLNGGVVINEPGADADTRIEGDTDANLFFADASTDRIGIGTSSPATKLDVNGITQSRGNLYGGTSNTTANVLAYANVANGGAGFSQFLFANTSTETRGYLTYTHASDALLIGTAGATKATLDSSGNLGLGVTPSASWRTDATLAVLEVKSAGSAIWNAGARNFNFSNNSYWVTGGSFQYASTGAAAWYQQTGGEHRFYNAASGTAGNTITFTQAMTLDASGNLGVGTTSPGNRLHVSGNSGDLVRVSGAAKTLYINCDSGGGGIFTGAAQTGAAYYLSDTNGYAAIFTSSTERARITAGGDWQVKTGASAAVIAKGGDTDAEGWNGAQTSLYVGKVNGTGRSINAGGTINASGTDYAEYMTKAGDFVIAKGDVCGIDANGKLTNVFADAVSFVVKSTNPSYVGGDSWGIGIEGEELESARQKVDRIAFAGQVPVNVLGATPGQYIVPVDDNGAIKGMAVSNPTFEQYQSAVGKVIAVQDDGRALIIVKVA